MTAVPVTECRHEWPVEADRYGDHPERGEAHRCVLDAGHDGEHGCWCGTDTGDD